MWHESDRGDLESIVYHRHNGHTRKILGVFGVDEKRSCVCYSELNVWLIHHPLHVTPESFSW